MQAFYNSLVLAPQAEQGRMAQLARLMHIEPSLLDRLAARFVWNEWS